MRILTVLGARPQFIKAAPLSRSLADQPNVEEVILTTGQHHDPEMSSIFFEELEMPEPSFALGVHGGTHGQMTGRMLERLDEVLAAVHPDLVLVYGDTNSTLAGALAAAKAQVRVAHVEAGLRSFNRAMPEEINRVLTDHLSALLFCPTTRAVDNLGAEGIRRGVHLSGDVMYDVAIDMAARAGRRSSVHSDLGLQPSGYAVCTVHRAENTDDPDRLRAVLSYVRADAHSLDVVFPLHPRTAKAVAAHGVDLGAFMTTPPLGYLDMTALVRSAARVYTDSGGLQKEAYFHRVPCVTLREETEWVETVEHGWNRLWRQSYSGERREITEYGDGRAARHIAEVLAREG